MILVSFWDEFGIILGWFWYHFGMILVSFWDDVGISCLTKTDTFIQTIYDVKPWNRCRIVFRIIRWRSRRLNNSILMSFLQNTFQRSRKIFFENSRKIIFVYHMFKMTQGSHTDAQKWIFKISLFSIFSLFHIWANSISSRDALCYQHVS